MYGIDGVVEYGRQFQVGPHRQLQRVVKQHFVRFGVLPAHKTFFGRRGGRQRYRLQIRERQAGFGRRFTVYGVRPQVGRRVFEAKFKRHRFKVYGQRPVGGQSVDAERIGGIGLAFIVRPTYKPIAESRVGRQFGGRAVFVKAFARRRAAFLMWIQHAQLFAQGRKERHHGLGTIYGQRKGGFTVYILAVDNPVAEFVAFGRFGRNGQCRKVFVSALGFGRLRNPAKGRVVDAKRQRIGQRRKHGRQMPFGRQGQRQRRFGAEQVAVFIPTVERIAVVGGCTQRHCRTVFKRAGAFRHAVFGINRQRIAV